MDLKAHKLAKTARALLVAEYTELGIEPQAAQLMAQGHQPGGVHYAAVKALIAALTPPEGYVLVPAEAVKQCACGCGRYCCTHCGTELGGLAARPEAL